MLIPFLLISAPEIIRGEDYDEKADIFSFGIILWWVIYLFIYLFSCEEAIVATQLIVYHLPDNTDRYQGIAHQSCSLCRPQFHGGHSWRLEGNI